MVPLPNSSENTWRRGPGVAAGTWRYAAQEGIAERYDDFIEGTPLCGLDHEIVREVFPRRTSPGSRPRILDLGCGTGRTTRLLSSRGYDVVAIDLSQPMLKRLAAADTSSCTDPSAGQVTPIRGNLVRLDFLAPQSCAGAVCLFSTLGMIQGRHHRRAMLAGVARTVCSDGPLVVHVHHRYASLRQAGGAWNLLVNRWQSWWRREIEFGDAQYAYRGLPDMFLHRFSRRELVADVMATGWRIETIHPLSLHGSEILARDWRSRFQIAGGFILIGRKENR